MSEIEWGSDAIAELLRRLQFGYAAIVPGASFRGLHDSFVNYLSDDEPQMLVCLHEEHAVAIAHGYAKVTGKPMLAVVHANVGLMHASMAIYDAWADRVPLVILGANGPRDAAKRRPWIDWLHTSRDVGASVRGYTKWDDEPASVEAALESIVRAHQIACTPPYGPTLVVLDVAMQEEELTATPAMPKLGRFRPPSLPVPAADDVRRTIEILDACERPIILIGRVKRDQESWNDRVCLAELFGARVISDMKVGSTFPTDHQLFVGIPTNRLTPEGITALREADAILSLDSVDLAGTLKQAFGNDDVSAPIISCSVDRYIHNGASMDHQALPTIDLNIAVPVEQFVSALVLELSRMGRPANRVRNTWSDRVKQPAPVSNKDRVKSVADQMSMNELVAVLDEVFAGETVCYSRLPLSTNSGARMTFHHPLDYLGADGGGGIGSGPGIAVGAALGLKGTECLPVTVLGDGDLLMGLTALWTAVANKIPLLVIVANNRCYQNDVAHQERMALQRKRPVERKWIGQMLDDPAPDFALLARGQGAVGIGPIAGYSAFKSAIADAIVSVKQGHVVVVDVMVAPEA